MPYDPEHPGILLGATVAAAKVGPLGHLLSHWVRGDHPIAAAVFE